MKIKINQIRKNIFCIIFPNQYLLCSTFFRLQEFYESPFRNIQNKYFSLEKIMDIYACKNKNDLSYFKDWEGFNIPGHVLKKFFKVFNSDLLNKEKILKKLITSKILNNPNKTYLIATFKTKKSKRILNHEIAHGYRYLYSDYKKNMDSLIKEMPCKKSIINSLQRMGYSKNVLKDEIQSYFSTSDISDIKMYFPSMKKSYKKYQQYYSFFKVFFTKFNLLKESI